MDMTSIYVREREDSRDFRYDSTNFRYDSTNLDYDGTNGHDDYSDCEMCRLCFFKIRI